MGDERMDDMYRLKSGKHWVNENGQPVCLQPGAVVELSAEEVAVFGDKFEKIEPEAPVTEPDVVIEPEAPVTEPDVVIEPEAPIAEEAVEEAPKKKKGK